MQIVKRASLLVLVVFAQGLWVTDAAAYSSGMNSDLAGQSVHGFNGSGFATGDPVSGSTTTCAASGCHTGSAFPDGDVVLDWTNGAGGGEPTIIPPGVPTNFGVRLQNGNTSVGAIGFNATARKNGSHDRFGTFVVSTPVQVWDEITKPPSGIIQGGHAGPEIGHTAPQTRTHEFTWTFTPDVDENFKFYACINQVSFTDPTDGLLNDGPPVCGTRSITVTNNNPAANNESGGLLNINQGGSVTNFDVFANEDATDVDGHTISFGSFTAPSGYTISGSTFSFSTGFAYDYLDSTDLPEEFLVEYTVTDGWLGSAAGTATISIQGLNDTPIAEPDGAEPLGAGHVSINEGASVSGAGDLLFNDDDVDTNDKPNLVASRAGPGCAAVSTTESNSFTLDSTAGTFNYSHDGTEPVQDSFSYCAFDGTAYSSPVIVYIDILPINDDPTIEDFVGDVGYTEQVPVAIEADAITIKDDDSTEINRMRVSITSGFATGDTLSCNGTPAAGITCGSFDIPTRTLTLSSASSPTPTSHSYAEYAAALNLIEFNNATDNNPSGARTISLDIRDEDLGTSTAYTKMITPITRTNDSPSLAAIIPPVPGAPNTVNANAFENTVADPYTFQITAVASDPDVDDDKNDGDASNSLRYSLSNAPTGMTISNAAANPGLISWQPPITGTFGLEYKDITVQVIEVGQIGAVPATQRFTLFVSPPDGDVDGIANYNDTCVTFNDPSNLNTDGDGTPGTDGPGADEGGNECDNDDDGDGISDIDEGLNGLDPLDKNDADLDNDGDGISNRDEIANGTNPNLGNLVIDATGYFTAYELLPPTPTSIHKDATAVTANDYGPYRPGDNTITWTPSNAEFPDLTVTAGLRLGLVSDPPTHPFFIRPLVNFAVNQQVEENDSADITVTVTLNGDSPSWPANPATVSYTVSGTASVADHTAAAGDLTFNDGEYRQTITFRALNDAIADADETVVFTLTDASNAVIGSKNTHTATIVESNVAPMVALQFSQGGVVIGSTYADEVGVITIDALATDVNSAQIPTLSYDWSGTDQLLGPPLATNVSTWPPAIPPGTGTYLIDVVVTDSGAASTRISRILHVAADMAPGNITDFDGDGIPQFLDGDDASTANGNLMPDQTFDLTETLLLETETGLTLRRGSTTLAANRFGALLAPSDIERYGSVNGTPPLNAEDDFEHVGGIYDFEIHGLIPGSSARIVIPLQSGIPKNAVYRKFNPATGWSSFVVDDNNQIASAVGDLGACPEPGSSAYRSGLQYLDNCIQLTIKDGGPNDTDNTVNGVINDPATVGVALKDPQIEEVEEGSGRVSSLLLAILLSLVGFAFWRRRRGFNID